MLVMLGTDMSEWLFPNRVLLDGSSRGRISHSVGSAQKAARTQNERRTSRTRALDEQGAMEACHYARIKTLTPGEVLWRLGDAAADLVFVLRGSIAVCVPSRSHDNPSVSRNPVPRTVKVVPPSVPMAISGQTLVISRFGSYV